MTRIPMAIAIALIATSCNTRQPKDDNLLKVAKNDYYIVYKKSIKINEIDSDSPYPAEAIPIDINNDKKIDFALFGLKFPFSHTDAEVPIWGLINKGNGIFELEQSFKNIKSIHARAFVSTDLNDNKRQDLVFADHGVDLPPFSGGVSKILLNTDKGFQTLTPMEKAFTFFVDVADVDADGKPDIFFNNISFNNDKLHSKLFFQTDSASFKEDNSALPKMITRRERNFLATKFFDFNNNDRPDLFLGGLDYKEKDSVQARRNEHDIILINKGGAYTDDNIITLPKRYPDRTWGTVDATFADINKNGFLDIVTATHNHGFYKGAIQIYFNKDGKKFSTKIITPKDAYNFWIPWVKVCDINNDGKEDILFTIRQGSLKESTIKHPLRIYIQKNDMAFEDQSHLIPSNNIMLSSAHCLDFNNDGINDIFATGYDQSYYLYQGTQKKK